MPNEQTKKLNNPKDEIKISELRFKSCINKIEMVLTLFFEKTFGVTLIIISLHPKGDIIASNLGIKLPFLLGAGVTMLVGSKIRKIIAKAIKSE